MTTWDRGEDYWALDEGSRAHIDALPLPPPAVLDEIFTLLPIADLEATTTQRDASSNAA